MLTSALQRGALYACLPAAPQPTSKAWGSCWDDNPGHMMSVPIVTEDKETLGGILVLSPYSERAWRAEDQAFLSNISMALVPIIRRSQRASLIEQKQQETLAASTTPANRSTT